MARLAQRLHSGRLVIKTPVVIIIGGNYRMTIDKKLDLHIAIPTLNCIGTIRDTVESLRRFWDHDTRVVVADRYSTDGTYEYARGAVDAVLQVFKGNLYAAVNAALEGMDSEWMPFINGDDVLYSDTVGQALEPWSLQADLIYGNTIFVDIGGVFLHSWSTHPPNDFIPMAANHVMPITQPGTLFRKAVFKKLNGFETSFRLSADFDFFLRAKTAAKDPIAKTLVLVEWQNLKIPFLRRKMAMFCYKLRNSENYFIPMLRYRSLMGRYLLPNSVLWSKRNSQSGLRTPHLQAGGHLKNRCKQIMKRYPDEIAVVCAVPTSDSGPQQN
jgi:glycosyltransferase involved in cell wall biosynthesis